MYHILLLYNLILYVDDNALVKDSKILLSPFLCEDLPLVYKIPWVFFTEAWYFQ
jgi:hypothetical protein